MPRPRMHRGRPGTRVIPARWEADHAAVVVKTMTATCIITAPAAGEPAYDPVLGYSVPPAGATLYDGPCRVQISNTQADTAVAAEEPVASAAYVVEIDRGADRVVVNALVRITASEDGSLTGRRLAVRGIARGSLRFARDLTCVDDLTQPTPQEEV